MIWVMDICHWVVRVVLRPQERKGFVLLPKRWVVERTFGVLSSFLSVVVARLSPTLGLLGHLNNSFSRSWLYLSILLDRQKDPKWVL